MTDNNQTTKLKYQMNSLRTIKQFHETIDNHFD